MCSTAYWENYCTFSDLTEELITNTISYTNCKTQKQGKYSKLTIKVVCFPEDEIETGRGIHTFSSEKAIFSLDIIQ